MTPDALRKRALQHMGQHDYAGAIDLWRQVVAVEPSTENWNDLSYAYLQTQQWEQARQAAEKALDAGYRDKVSEKALAPIHYNLGMAELALHDDRAVFSLDLAAGWEPDRFEPLLALGRAYATSGRYTLARYALQQAQHLATDNQEIQQRLLDTQNLIDADVKHIPPDLLDTCAAKLVDTQVTLCVYPTGEKAKPTDATQRFDLYALPARGGKVARMSLGPLIPGGYFSSNSSIDKVALPGNRTGYWLFSTDRGAGIAHATEMRLFLYTGTDLHQVLFTGNSDQFVTTASDFIRGQLPTVQGDLIRTSHPDDANGTRIITITWRLDAAAEVAAQTSHTEQPR